MKLVQYNEYLLWVLITRCFSTRASVGTIPAHTHAFPVIYGLNKMANIEQLNIFKYIYWHKSSYDLKFTMFIPKVQITIGHHWFY